MPDQESYLIHSVPFFYIFFIATLYLCGKLYFLSKLHTGATQHGMKCHILLLTWYYNNINSQDNKVAFAKGRCLTLRFHFFKHALFIFSLFPSILLSPVAK